MYELAISVSDFVCIIASVIFGYGLTNLKASRWKLHRAIKHWVPIAFCFHSTLLLSLVVLLKHLYFLKLDYRCSVRRTKSCLKEEFFTLFTAVSQVSTCHLCAWGPCMGVHWAMALIGAAKQATSVVLRSQTLSHSGYGRLPQVRGKDLSGLVETGLMSYNLDTNDEALNCDHTIMITMVIYLAVQNVRLVGSS